MKYFEDVGVGEKMEIGQYTFTADAIKAFAARFDPQPFHLDETAARNSPFGGLCASGWHTACMWMRLLVDHRRREDSALAMGVSPGFRDLVWAKPVYAGDTISYATEVIGLRGSSRRPGWGIMTARNTGINQHGEPVLSFTSSVFVARRPT